MKNSQAFWIRARQLGWLDGPGDDPHDLCLHGEVTVQAGAYFFTYCCCASAAALRMLQTISEDRLCRDTDNGEQMLPCCGFCMYPTLDPDRVFITGCDHGVNYNVRPRGNRVLLSPKRGPEIAVPFPLYRREVLAFARQVEAAYCRSRPKQLPQDPFDREWYRSFWREWAWRMKAQGETPRLPPGLFSP